MPVTITDIARKAGVSISTVSNVMNGRKNVGSETTSRVLKLCEELNYIPNIAGKSLRGTRSKSILFNFSDFDRAFYLKIIEGVNDCAREYGYDLFICTTRSCEKFFYNHLTSGAIILDSRMRNDTLAQAGRNDYPIVVLDRSFSHRYIKNVVVNNYAPMKELIENLTAAGYRDFAFLGGLEHTDDNRERRLAFFNALAERSIPFSQQNYFSGDWRETSGYGTAKKLLERKRLPEALICANDNMAFGAIKAFEEAGVRAGTDIALTGFDDAEAASGLGLTTVAIPNYERGFTAANALIECIEQAEESGGWQPRVIEAEIKWRASVPSRPPQGALNV